MTYYLLTYGMPKQAGIQKISDKCFIVGLYSSEELAEQARQDVRGYISDCDCNFFQITPLLLDKEKFINEQTTL